MLNQPYSAPTAVLSRMHLSPGAGLGIGAQLYPTAAFAQGVAMQEEYSPPMFPQCKRASCSLAIASNPDRVIITDDLVCSMTRQFAP